MFLQIINLILDVATGLVGGACLMRLVMQWQRLPFQNPIGRFVFAVTDWLVMPLRRVLPAMGRLDTSSLAAAWLMKLSHVTAMWVLGGTQAAFVGVLVASLFGVLHWLVSGLSAIILLYAILSWVQPNSGSMMLLSRIVEPWLAPHPQRHSSTGWHRPVAFGAVGRSANCRHVAGRLAIRRVVRAADRVRCF